MLCQGLHRLPSWAAQVGPQGQQAVLPVATGCRGCSGGGLALRGLCTHPGTAEQQGGWGSLSAALLGLDGSASPAPPLRLPFHWALPWRSGTKQGIIGCTEEATEGEQVSRPAGVGLVLPHKQGGAEPVAVSVPSHVLGFQS